MSSRYKDVDDLYFKCTMVDELWQRFDEISLRAQRGDWSQVITQFEALLQAKLSNDLRAHVHNDLGVAYQSTGEPAQASEHFRASYEIYEKDQNRLGAAIALGNLGVAHVQQREWGAAIECLERALVVFENQKIENLAVAKLRVDLGDALAASHLPKRASEQYELALMQQEAAGDKRAMSMTLHALGVSLRARARWEDAIKAFERSMALFEELGDAKNLATTLNRLGELYYEVRDYAHAVEIHQRDLKLAEAAKNQTVIAQVLNNLALAYQGQKDFAQAATQYRRAIPLWEKLGDQKGLALALWGRAQMHFEQDEPEQALKVGARAQTILAKLGHPDEEGVRKWLAMVRRGKRTGIRRYL